MPRRAPDALKEVIRDFRRDQIIDTARRLFGEKGTTDVPMDAVAAEAGVSRSTVYVYFANRDELLQACVQSMYERLQETIGLVVAEDTPPLQRLHALILGVLERIDESPDFFRLAMATQATTGAAGSAAVGGTLMLIGLDMIRVLEELVTAGIATGDFRPGLDPERAVVLVGQQIYGALSVRAGEPEPIPAAKAADSRGYRLAENVRLIPEREVNIVAASKTRLQVEVKESKPRHWLVVALAAAVLVIIAGGTFWYVRHRAPVLTGKDTLVLADFANSTGNPVFDGTLRQGFSVQLAQSPYLSLVSDERIQHTLQLMGRTPDVHLSPEIARGVCVRTGSTAVLEGSIANLGKEYVLGLRATDCRNGNVLDEEQAQAAREEDVINVLSQISGRLRKKLGESLATIDQHNTPLAEATTPSLEALRAFGLGWKATFGPAGPGEAIPFFQRAIQLDPNFAIAYAMLGRVYADMGESALSIENTTKAYRLQDRASDPERFFITMSYELLVTGNLEKGRQIGELWSQTYPRDERPFGFLSFIYQDLGRYDKSVDAGKAALEIDADSVPAYANLAWAYIFTGNLNDAQATIRRASERNLEFPDLYILLYDIAFLQNDPEGMKHAVEMTEGKLEPEHWILERQACVLAYSGRAQEARNSSHRAIQLAQQAGQSERAALYQVASATREALLGHKAEAKAGAVAGLSGAKYRDVEYGAAFALAFTGDEARALPIMKDLEKRYPDDTFVRFSYLPTLRAILAESHGNPSQALQELEPETPYDVAIAGSWAGFFGDMYPVYVRGLAYLAMHKGNEAASEFQKIIDHRGVVGSDPIGSLARLQLARSYSLAGDKMKAKSAYEDFLKLWHHADRDLPILKAAEAEYSSKF